MILIPHYDFIMNEGAYQTTGVHHTRADPLGNRNLLQVVGAHLLPPLRSVKQRKGRYSYRRTVDQKKGSLTPLFLLFP